MFMEIMKQTGLWTALQSDFINSEMISKLGDLQTQEIFDNLIEKLSKSPAYTTLRVNTLHTTRQEVKTSLMQAIPQYEVLVHPILSDVLIVVCTKSHSQPIPTDTEVIVSLKCGLSVLRGASIYVPGVLGAPKSLKKGEIVSVFCDIDGKCLRGTTKLYTGKKYYLGNGVARWDRRNLFVSQDACGIAVEMIHPVIQLPSLNGVFPNSIFLQNLPSIVCGHVLNPQSGECILDMCAAPGGKTTHLGALMENTGVIIALDKSENKVRNINANAQRLDLSCIYAFVYDATKCLSESCSQSSPTSGPPFRKETFDKVLVDAPCSCLGQRPQLINKMTPIELNSFSKVQKKLLRNAVELVKKGGCIVYSTCTFTIQENEAIVKWVLDSFPQMKLIEQSPYLGEPGLYGAGLSDKELLKLQRFGLSSSTSNVENDTIAFFIAKFVKV